MAQSYCTIAIGRTIARTISWVVIALVGPIASVNVLAYFGTTICSMISLRHSGSWVNRKYDWTLRLHGVPLTMNLVTTSTPMWSIGHFFAKKFLSLPLMLTYFNCDQYHSWGGDFCWWNCSLQVGPLVFQTFRDIIVQIVNFHCLIYDTIKQQTRNLLKFTHIYHTIFPMFAVFPQKETKIIISHFFIPVYHCVTTSKNATFTETKSSRTLSFPVRISARAGLSVY